MKNYTIILALTLIVFPSALSLAIGNSAFGGRAAGMGNAAVAVYDFWGLSHNQAGLTQISAPTAGFYFENRYLAREMSFGAIGFAMPAVGGVIGMSMSYFGFSQYNESKFGIAYSRAFGPQFSAGVQLNYLHTFIGEGYGSSGNIAAELGMIYEPIEGLRIGAHIFNPTRTRISQHSPQRIPTIFRLGMAYHFSDRVLATIETEKDLERDPVFKAGIEYGITEKIFVRGGIGTEPTTNAFGIGIYLGSLKMDIAASFHNVLGYSPQASLRYEF